MPQQAIYTIGHGGRTAEHFLQLLRQHDIAYLIDVRSQPYSRYQPGRDGERADCHLFCAFTDIMTIKHFIEQGDPGQWQANGQRPRAACGQ